MDYEKAYLEALDRAKAGKPMDEVFPELKESEDERIRKALIKQFSAISMETWAGIPKIDIISWLERQKERGPLSKDEEYTLARIIEYLEDNDCPSEWKNLLHDVYSLPYQKEQQPAEWSEEDELMRRRCIADLGYLTEYEPQYKERYDAQIDWLKSIQKRFILQPKQEWNEEDVLNFPNQLSK